MFWDFDGTLGHGPGGPGAWVSCLLTALDRHHPGHSCDSTHFDLSSGFPWHTPLAPHTEVDDPDAWWRPLEELFAAQFAAAGFHDTAVLLARATREAFNDWSQWGVYEDAVPALTRLSKAGWSNVVLSNHTPELEDNLRHIGIRDLFDCVISSAVIGYEKPHPRAFEIALQLADNPQRRWMVGDNFVADVQGAEAAGIPAILVRKPHPQATWFASGVGAAASLILDREDGCVH